MYVCFALKPSQLFRIVRLTVTRKTVGPYVQNIRKILVISLLFGTEYWPMYNNILGIRYKFLTSPCLRELIPGFPARRPVFTPPAVHKRFTADKRTLEQGGYCGYFGLPASVFIILI
jgi:hypothetical protein